MINPPDAVVAARSFPRRWRELFASTASDDDGREVLQRSGAPALAQQAAGVLETTATRLLHGATATYGHARGLDLLEHHANFLAQVIDRVRPEDWTDDRMEALTEGIDAAAELLRRAEAAIEEARAARGG